MVAIVLSLAAVAGIGAVGAAFLRLADPRRHLSEPLRWALFIPAGTIVVAWYLFAASWLGVRVSAWSVVPLAGVSAAGLGWVRLRRAQPPPAEPKADRGRIDGSDILVIAAIAALVVVWLQRTFTFPMHAWDALMTWGYKAKVIYHETIGGTEYFQNGRAKSHLPYPLLVPLNMAWIAGFVGRFDDICVRAVFPLLAGSAGLTLYAGLRRFLRPAAAAALPLGMMLTRAFGFRATYAEADVALAAMAIATVVLLAEYLITGHRTFLVLGAVTSAGAAFTKNEGLVLCVVAAASLAVCGRGRGAGWARRRLAPAAGYACLCLGLLLPWLVFRAYIPQTDEHYAAHLRPSVVADNLRRLPTIVWAIGASIADARHWAAWPPTWPDWLLIWPMVVLGLSCLGRRAMSGPALFVLLVFVGQLSAYVLIYTITPDPLDEQLSVTVERLLLHVLPLACYVSGMGLARTAVLGRRPGAAKSDGG